MHLRRKVDENPDDLILELRGLVNKDFPEADSSLLTDQHLQLIIKTVSERINKVRDIPSFAFYYWREPTLPNYQEAGVEKMWNDKAGKRIQIF